MAESFSNKISSSCPQAQTSNRASIDYLNILQMNAQSLLNYERRFKLENGVKVRNYNTVCVSETWLNERLKDIENFLVDYIIYRKSWLSEDRIKDGGALSAVNNTICYRKKKNEVDASLTCEAIIEGSIIHLCVFYNPPENSPYGCDVDSITNVLRKILQNRFAVLCEDLHLPSICWDTWNSNDESEKHVLSLFENRFIQQAVKHSATRKTCSTWYYTKTKQHMLPKILTLTQFMIAMISSAS